MYDAFQASEVSIWSWNVNGIRATLNSGKLTEFLKDADPDVLCLNETKADFDKIDKQKIWEAIPSEYE